MSRQPLARSLIVYQKLFLLSIRRAYKLIDIEKYQPSGRGSPKLTSLQTADTIKSIADLVAFVKSYDKYFSAAPEVSKAILNDDGTPKVFYHGSIADFTVFDIKKAKRSGLIPFRICRRYSRELRSSLRAMRSRRIGNRVILAEIL